MITKEWRYPTDREMIQQLVEAVNSQLIRIEALENNSQSVLLNVSPSPLGRSVPAEYWYTQVSRFNRAIDQALEGSDIPAKFTRDAAINMNRSYWLAAAVTRWYEDPKNDHSHLDYMKLERIVGAFVRGEELS